MSTETRWLPSDASYTPAIMRSIDFVESRGGGVVFIPPDERWRPLSRSSGVVCVELPTGVWLRGGGAQSTKLRYIDTAHASHMISVAPGGARGHAVTDMHLDHGREGRNDEPGQSGHIIRNLDASDFRFERLTLDNARGYCIGNFVDDPQAERRNGVFKDLVLRRLGADGIDFKAAGDVANRYTDIRIENIAIDGFGAGVGIDLRCLATVNGVTGQFSGQGRQRSAVVRTRGTGFGSSISDVRAYGPGREHRGCSAVVALGQDTRVSNIFGRGLDRVIHFPDQEAERAPGVPSPGSCRAQDISGEDCNVVALVESDGNTVDGLTAVRCGRAFVVAKAASETRFSRLTITGAGTTPYTIQPGAVGAYIDNVPVTS